MGKLYEKIIKRNSIDQRNQEYEIMTYDDFGDKLFRGYSMKSKFKRMNDIIEEIESGKDYRTNDKTPVDIYENDNGKYLQSIPNGTEDDNLLSLEKYTR